MEPENMDIAPEITQSMVQLHHALGMKNTNAC
jgi:hypothetical protein